MVTLTTSQQTRLAIDKGMVFALLRGGVMNGQSWILEAAEDDTLLFYLTDPYTEQEYCTTYRRHAIHSLGIWEYYFLEMYPTDEDEETGAD